MPSGDQSLPLRRPFDRWAIPGGRGASAVARECIDDLGGKEAIRHSARSAHGPGLQEQAVTR
jgi:hypothetical protein